MIRRPPTHPDCTVGPGIAPGQPPEAGRGLYRAVWNLTQRSSRLTTPRRGVVCRKCRCRGRARKWTASWPRPPGTRARLGEASAELSSRPRSTHYSALSMQGSPVERFDDHRSARGRTSPSSSDKVGNFVVTTPLLRGLRENDPDSVIDFFGGEIGARLRGGRSPYIAARLFYARHRRRRPARRLPCRLAPSSPRAGRRPGRTRWRSTATSSARHQPGRGESGRAALHRRRRAQPRLPPQGVGCDSPHDRLLAHDDWNGAGFVARHAARRRQQPHRRDLLPPGAGRDRLLPHRGPDRTALRRPGRAVARHHHPRRAKLWPVAHWAEVARWCAERGLGVGLLGHRARSSATPSTTSATTRSGCWTTPWSPTCVARRA